MCLDYGSKTVGVAFSDALGLTAQPFETIVREKESHLRRTLARLSELISEQEVGLIVLGRPVNMDGSDGERVRRCEAFREQLEGRTGLPVVWQDERLTTVEADGLLDEMGVPREQRKRYIDAVAASVILRDYMNANRIGEREEEYGQQDHHQR